MATVLAVILIAVVLFLPAGLPGRMKSDEAWGGWRSKNPRVNRLSLARMFLFGARDVWFVVSNPVYFKALLSDGTADGLREAFFLIGSFLALWIIAYGAVQAFAPGLLGANGQPEAETTRNAEHTARRIGLSSGRRLWLSLDSRNKAAPRPPDRVYRQALAAVAALLFQPTIYTSLTHMSPKPI